MNEYIDTLSTTAATFNMKPDEFHRKMLELSKRFPTTDQDTSDMLAYFEGLVASDA